jgi:hypothetical protein
MRVLSLLVICALGAFLMFGVNLLASPVLASTINATVDIHPETLNLKSGGRWITACIELPEGYDAGDIDVSTILLDDVIPAEANSKYGFVKNDEIEDGDNNAPPGLMVKFDRQAVINHVLNEWSHIVPFPETVDLTITGLLIDGVTAFEGVDTIRVTHP